MAARWTPTEAAHDSWWYALSTNDRVAVGKMVCVGYGVEDISLRLTISEDVVRSLIGHYRSIGWLRGMLENGWHGREVR